jgi:hypothetical protein
MHKILSRNRFPGGFSAPRIVFGYFEAAVGIHSPISAFFGPFRGGARSPLAVWSLGLSTEMCTFQAAGENILSRNLCPGDISGPFWVLWQISNFGRLEGGRQVAICESNPSIAQDCACKWFLQSQGLQSQMVTFKTRHHCVQPCRRMTVLSLFRSFKFICRT